VENLIVISYPGGKHDFYPQIRARIPVETRVFCEPFVGGGSTTLNVLADMEFALERVVIGDFSPRIAAFWRSVIKEPVALSERYDEFLMLYLAAARTLGPKRDALEELAWHGKVDGKELSESDKERFKRVEATRQAIIDVHKDFVKREYEDDLSVAAQVALLHSVSFSGVAFLGGASHARVIKRDLGQKKDAFVKASKLLNSVDIEVVCGSYEDTCAKVLGEVDNLIYLDPPYVLQADNLYEYGKFDHTKLAEYLLGLAPENKWLLSYDDSALTRKNYQQAFVETYKLPRGYTTAVHGKETSLDGEEVFVSNFKI
jgi:site-specific DNA-adenine methylase